MATSTTTNDSNFSVAYLDASALILDAHILLGSDRKAKLEEAKGQIKRAKTFAHMPEETVLVNQLKAVVNYYEIRHLNV